MIALVFLSVLGVALSQVSTTTSEPLVCPGGSVAYQDIAILYDLTFYPNDSLDLSKQLQQAIAYTLFSGPTYWYDYVYGKRITQVALIPFPKSGIYNTFADDYIYGTIKTTQDMAEKLARELRDANLPLLGHPTESKITDALNYLITYVQNSRRPAPIENTIVIIAKRDTDVANAKPLVDALKNNGSKIMTIGIGTDNTDNLATLATSQDYVFSIADFTNEIRVDEEAQWIAGRLASDCGTTFDFSSTIPTTPMTTVSSSTTSTAGVTTSTSTASPNTGSTMPTSTSSIPTGSTLPPQPSASTGAPITVSSSPDVSNSTSSASTTTTSPVSPTTHDNQDRAGSANTFILSYTFLVLSGLVGYLMV